MESIPGNVSLIKDKQNLIGISIGGGAPLCPCLYIVQVGSITGNLLIDLFGPS